MLLAASLVEGVLIQGVRWRISVDCLCLAFCLCPVLCCCHNCPLPTEGWCCFECLFTFCVWAGTTARIYCMFMYFGPGFWDKQGWIWRNSLKSGHLFKSPRLWISAGGFELTFEPQGSRVIWISARGVGEVSGCSRWWYVNDV